MPNSPRAEFGNHADLTALHVPGALDSFLPRAFATLHPRHLDEDDPSRYFCVLYYPSQDSTDMRGSIRVFIRDHPVGGGEAAGEAELYPEPFFHYEPVPRGLREKYGEHAFVATTTDELAGWALTSDTLRTRVQYPIGEVTSEELWHLAAYVHRVVRTSPESIEATHPPV